MDTTRARFISVFCICQDGILREAYGNVRRKPEAIKRQPPTSRRRSGPTTQLARPRALCHRLCPHRRRVFIPGKQSRSSPANPVSAVHSIGEAREARHQSRVAPPTRRGGGPQHAIFRGQIQTSVTNNWRGSSRFLQHAYFHTIQRIRNRAGSQ